ncbi:MAG: glycogen synthase GlgA [Opitutaceae bacterium]|jgi:starch synthase|nr:glycogen synthase GlgA [Opitutaceae bacterium]
MKIVHVASELFPYVKTGGLADAVGSLASTLAGAGHEVSVFIPGYSAALAHPAAAAAERVLRLKIEMGDTFMTGEVKLFSPRPNLGIYTICREEFFDRRGAYGNGERDYEDNYQRYIFFCKGAVETLRLLEMQADIVHAHDWQAALTPLLLRHAENRYGTTLALKTVFTIHNIAFQGLFPMRAFPHTNLPDELRGIDGLEYYGQMNFMKGGILFADRVTTVSPRYAREIQTPEYGCGLDGVVASRAEDLTGLLNGLDPAIWNPATDAHLPANYSAADMTGKAVCRETLLKKTALEPAPGDTPVFGMVCRLTEQKGVQLLLDNRDFFLRHDCRLVVLGSGDRRLEDGLRALAASRPGKIALAARLDEAMSHLIEAGADFFVMPSMFEPCGLNQMYSQAYGTPPLVTCVGGLADTVTDIDAAPDGGTGIMFPPTVAGLRHGLKRALALFADKPALAAVRARAMQRDFSWAGAARAYVHLYEEAL